MVLEVPPGDQAPKSGIAFGGGVAPRERVVLGSQTGANHRKTQNTEKRLPI